MAMTSLKERGLDSQRTEYFGDYSSSVFKMVLQRRAFDLIGKTKSIFEEK
jgi:hypothetical protein